MHRQPPILYTDPAKVVTLEVEVPPDDSAEPTGPTRRVLLLEDRDDFREVLRDRLDSRLFQVTSVPSGVEGLREVAKDAFDLIICDMMMPKLNGEMFYWATTRARPAAAERFIFITGHYNDAKVRAFFQRVNAVALLKPFQLKELNSAIADLLARL